MQQKLKSIMFQVFCQRTMMPSLHYGIACPEVSAEIYFFETEQQNRNKFLAISPLIAACFSAHFPEVLD